MTLVQFWTQQRDLYKSKTAALTTSLKDQQEALRKQDKALQDAQKDVAANDASIADKRAALAKATIPADAQALVLEIRDLQIKQRSAMGNLLDQQDVLNAMQSQLDGGNGQLQRLTALLADAEAQLKSAIEAEKRRDELKTRATSAPVRDVPSQAGAAKAVELANASTKIDQLPSGLRSLAEKRFANRSANIVDATAQALAAEDEWITQREAWGAEGRIEQERADFARAEQTVQAFASTAVAEYERAIAVLKAIAAGNVLTANEITSVAPTTARTDAAANADTVVDDQAGLHAAEVDLEKTAFGKLAADPDVDLSADATVTGKKKAVSDAKTTLKDDSTTNYPDKQVTDQWQVVVTDRSWKMVIDFLEAKATLDRLASILPAGLVSDLTNKEAAYAAALGDLIKAKRRLEYVEDAVAQRKKRAADLTASRGLRLLSAVRGDSF